MKGRPIGRTADFGSENRGSKPLPSAMSKMRFIKSRGRKASSFTFYSQDPKGKGVSSTYASSDVGDTMFFFIFPDEDGNSSWGMRGTHKGSKVYKWTQNSILPDDCVDFTRGWESRHGRFSHRWIAPGKFDALLKSGGTRYINPYIICSSYS